MSWLHFTTWKLLRTAHFVPQIRYGSYDYEIVAINLSLSSRLRFSHRQKLIKIPQNLNNLNWRPNRGNNTIPRMNGREFMRCTWTPFWITSILTCRYSRPKYRIHIFTETGNLKSQQWSPEGGPGAGILGGTLGATGTPLRWKSVCPLVLCSLRMFSFAFCFLLLLFLLHYPLNENYTSTSNHIPIFHVTVMQI